MASLIFLVAMENLDHNVVRVDARIATAATRCPPSGGVRHLLDYGHKRAGSIPVVPAWPRAVRRSWGGDASGAPTGPPPRYGVPVAGEALVAVLATAAQGAVLW